MSNYYSAPKEISAKNLSCLHLIKNREGIFSEISSIRTSYIHDGSKLIDEYLVRIENHKIMVIRPNDTITIKRPLKYVLRDL